MRNECYGCEKRHIGCHANCESYKAFCRERQRANEARRADHEARDVLSDGYANRTRKARRLDYKDMRRWRGT